MLTHHALARMQQRSISLGAVEALLAYGETRRRGGADIVFMTKRSRTQLQRDFGKAGLLRLEKALDSYLVVSDDGAVITAGHRQHRFKF